MTGRRVTSIPLASQRRVPWKNGLGTTREVATWPADADMSERFLWRVSVASVTQSCPFSAFDGHERTILLVSGDGFELDFDGAAPARTLTLPLDACTFQGEWRTRCRLLGGPVEDLNVMVDRARASAAVEVVRAPTTREVTSPATSLVVVAATHPGEVEVDGRTHALAVGDALRVDDAQGAVITVRPAGALVVATFAARGGE